MCLKVEGSPPMRPICKNKNLLDVLFALALAVMKRVAPNLVLENI